MSRDLRRAGPPLCGIACGVVLGALTLAAAPRLAAANAPQPAAPKQDVSSTPSQQSDSSGAQVDNPAEAAFQRGTSIIVERCASLRAAYDAGDRRPDLLSLLADCYLIEADVWRADALHDDAARLRASPSQSLPPPDAVDLSQAAQTWSAACAAFEESLSLEPSAGAQLAAALCRIRRGKLAASRELLDGMLPQLGALAASKDPFHKNRLALAEALLTEIDRVQPRLTVQVAGADSASPAEQGLTFTIEGKDVPPRLSRPLDAGTYEVAAAGLGVRAQALVTLAPRSHVVASLEVTPREVPRSWYIAAASLAGASALAAAGGGLAWWRADSLLEDLEATGGAERQEGFDCPNDRCRELASDINSARTLRGVAFIASAVAAGSAVAVYLMTPPVRPTQLRWLPAVDRGAVSLSVQGGF